MSQDHEAAPHEDLPPETARAMQRLAEHAEHAEQAQSAVAGEGATNDSIMRISVPVQIVLSTVNVPIATLMELDRGATIPLDHRIGEPVDVVVNGRVIARGDLVYLGDDKNRYAVSLLEVVSSDGA